MSIGWEPSMETGAPLLDAQRRALVERANTLLSVIEAGGDRSHVERAMLDEQEMEYLYDDGEYYYFMNTSNYEQMHLTSEILGDGIQYLVPQLKVNVEFYEGKPISVELPATVELTVVETEPGLKGATVSNVTKAAKTETGLVVQVPPFINQGEKVRVTTSDGSYQERA